MNNSSEILKVLEKRINESKDTYMDSLKMEDIPWIRLATPYGRAEKIPEYFQKLYSKDKEVLDNNLKNIKWNIEHQDTLWPVTPVALVFLMKKVRFQMNYFIAFIIIPMWFCSE